MRRRRAEPGCRCRLARSPGCVTLPSQRPAEQASEYADVGLSERRRSPGAGRLPDRRGRAGARSRPHSAADTNGQMSRPNRSTHQPAATALFLMSASPSAPLSVCLAMHAPIWHQAASSRSSSPMTARSVVGAGPVSSSDPRLAAGRRDRTAVTGSGASSSSSPAGCNPATSDGRHPTRMAGRGPGAACGALADCHSWRYAAGRTPGRQRGWTRSRTRTQPAGSPASLTRRLSSLSRTGDEAVSEANMVALQAFWPTAGLRWLAPSPPP